MVSLVWTLVAGSFGLLCYLAIPFAAASTDIRTRNKIAQFYYGMAARSIGRIAIVRRNVGGYSLKEMKVDDEKGAGKVVLDDSLLGDSKELHFDDPDNRLKRWKSKSFVLLHEMVPGAIDIQLAELGMHWRDHHSDGKHIDGEKVNPHFDVDDEIRCVNIDDVMPLILNGSEPTDPSTMEDYTRKRFEKYRDSVGAVEIITTFTGFAVGIGGVAALAWLDQNLLDEGTSEPEAPVELSITAMEWMVQVANLVVTIL